MGSLELINTDSAENEQNDIILLLTFNQQTEMSSAIIGGFRGVSGSSRESLNDQISSFSLGNGENVCQVKV